MSRNRDRLGGTNSGAPQAEPPVNEMMNNNETQHPFSFVVPTEFVELPSEGKYYPPGHPLHGQPTIEIKQMTAKEEDILTSQSLLKQGVALDRVLQSIIFDNRINVNSLLVGDKNALLVSCRVSGYGSDYNTQVTCPACQTKQEHTFDLNSLKINTGGNFENVTRNQDGTFTTVLPKSKLTATFRLLTGNDEKNTARLRTKNHNKRDRLVTGQLRSMLVSIEDNDTSEALDYVVENIPSMDSAHLRNCYKQVTPDLEMKQYFECSACDYSQDVEVPLTADFFWPNS